MSDGPPDGPAVLGEERLLERRLAAHEVGEIELSRGADDGRDVAGHPHAEDVILGDEVADARDGSEVRRRDGAREHQLDGVMGKVPERLGPVHAGEAAVPDDRDAIAGLLDLREDVRGQEHRPALALGLADHLVEDLLDERVEP